MTETTTTEPNTQGEQEGSRLSLRDSSGRVRKALELVREASVVKGDVSDYHRAALELGIVELATRTDPSGALGARCVAALKPATPTGPA